MNTVAFTGYRPQKLPFSEDYNDPRYHAFNEKLKRVIERLIELGYTDFISGVAIGFDTWAAEAVLEAKKKYQNIRLECAIPYPGQDRKWDTSDKIRRKKLISEADSATTVCNHYCEGCFFIRNEYMVDKADVVVCCFDGKSGGTAQTVRYAKEKDKIIVQINPNDAKVTIISMRKFNR